VLNLWILQIENKKFATSEFEAEIRAEIWLKASLEPGKKPIKAARINAECLGNNINDSGNKLKSCNQLLHEAHPSRAL
jgi:hypothetical protein